jgi:hypothetical protein
MDRIDALGDHIRRRRAGRVHDLSLARLTRGVALSVALSLTISTVNALRLRQERLLPAASAETCLALPGLALELRDAAAAAGAHRGNSRMRSASGSSERSPPLRSRRRTRNRPLTSSSFVPSGQCSPGRDTPLHRTCAPACLKNGCTPAARHCSMSEKPHSTQNGRALGPDSPPMITRSMPAPAPCENRPSPSVSPSFICTARRSTRSSSGSTLGWRLKQQGNALLRCLLVLHARAQPDMRQREGHEGEASENE